MNNLEKVQQQHAWQFHTPSNIIKMDDGDVYLTNSMFFFIFIQLWLLVFCFILFHLIITIVIVKKLTHDANYLFGVVEIQSNRCKPHIHIGGGDRATVVSSNQSV